MTIRLVDERVDDAASRARTSFHFENGLLGYVEHLNRSKTVVSPAIRISGEDEESGIVAATSPCSTPTRPTS